MRVTCSRSLRSAVLLVAALALVAASSLTASASTPLSGEELSNNTEDWTTIFGPNAADLCQGQGASRLPFTLQGPATGPYAGRFSETGVAIIGRRTATLHWDLDVGAGPVIGFRSSFTIVSGDTVIEGETWLARRGEDRPTAGCGSFTDATSPLSPGATFSGFEIVLNDIPVRYRATLTGPGSGSLVVSGTGTASLLAEHFVRTNCPPPPTPCASGSSGWGGGEMFS